ncbi:carbohydrate-binding family 9-like protein [Vallitalea okinawensis]|uniref:carbohydrate-binding family 9-like protein n=1 Tax=Vallitalea okinawensis TaxID=2078660 RepID=UPI000CFC2C7E|nr:carbohydrate-binding family 9-like protein [Vallitalea okinawensis]
MKTYLCHFSEEPITLDGNLNKEPWKSMESLELVETATGNKPLQRTIAKMCYTKESLYVVFSCIDDEINAVMTNYNDPIYNEEVVEIFIDATGELKQYIEIEVSPLNTVLHYAIHNHGGKVRGFARVDQVIKSVAKVSDDHWVVEMEIPLDELTDQAISSGTSWKGNLYRIDRRKNGEDEYSAWNATHEINFHRPECFGEIVFE